MNSEYKEIYTEKNKSNKTEKLNDQEPLDNSPSKTIILIHIIIILSIVNAFLIGFLIYYIIFKNQKELNNSNEGNNSIQISNKIKAIYKLEKGKAFTFFNKNESNLKEGDYIILKQTFSNKNLRNLDILELKGNFYTPEEDGNISVEILFKKNINNLKDFFKNSKQLLKIDLKDFNMEDVKSMESTFSGCSNLLEVDFGGVNSQNLINMHNTFENCKNIKTINLSMNNISQSLEYNNTFSGCENLEYINISSLPYISPNMFGGIKSSPKIYANEFISNDIKYIFHIHFNININIIIRNDQNNECIKGKNEKCKACSSIIKHNCATCNDGYYLPFNSIDRKKCLSCNIIEHCNSCFRNLNNILCSSCEEGYVLRNNKCKEKKNILPLCKIGDNELCKSCKSDKNECETCNEGFYLASDSDKTLCESCNKIKECIKCYGSSHNPICLKCKDGFKLEKNKCIEETCIVGSGDKCKTCKKEYGKEKECDSCNEGYYLEENKIPYKCKKCTIKNCKKCSFNSGYEICNECNNEFLLVKDDNSLAYSCICPTYYELTKENLCKKTGNWVEAEYEIEKNNYPGNLRLLEIYNTNIKLEDIDVYLNNTKIQLLVDHNDCYYNFSKLGRYTIKINFKKQLYDMSRMFNVDTIRKLKFLPGFDSTKVTSMEYFVGPFIESIDFNYLKTDSLENIENFAIFCNLISLDLSKFNTSKLKSMRGMIRWDKKLKEINLSSFDTSNVKKCENFIYSQVNTTVIISNKFTNCREFIPLELKVINIDEVSCKKFEHCKKCVGSMETLSCSTCELGYQLKDNKCILPKCIIGENEKCNSCNLKSNKECLTCNKGYYLPLNNKDKTKCTKCKVNGCEDCDKITGNCLKCQSFYKPILEEHTSKIISCEKLCEIGNENKCASCNMSEQNKCLSCNHGYKLIKDGTCKKIENSFTAIYDASSVSTNIKIFKYDIGNHDYFHSIEPSDIDAYINGTKINLVKNNAWLCYKFEKKGLNEVKIVLKKTLSTFDQFFLNCEKLVEIKFSETFDTSHVLNFDRMFYGCSSLKSADLSSFNTSLVSDMTYMFNGCSKLTSIDLSNFDTRNVLQFYRMFIFNYQLKWVDLSSFDTSNSNRPNSDGLFEKVPNKGTILINKKTYTLDIPNGWNIIYKDS